MKTSDESDPDSSVDDCTVDSAETEIALQNPRRFRALDLHELRPWLSRMLADVAPEASSLGVRFVGDDEMRELNRRYRGRDYATDVLSFAGGRSREGYHLGDLVISVPISRKQAQARGVSHHEEVRGLLLHGVLHCLGHDHETDDGRMARLEKRLRGRWLEDVG